MPDTLLTGELSPLDGTSDTWQAAGLHPIDIRYASTEETAKLWTSMHVSAHEARVDEATFLSQLLSALHLSCEEKSRIIEKFADLNQTQIDELQQLLQQEANKFANIPAEDQQRMDVMLSSVLQDWLDYEKQRLAATMAKTLEDNTSDAEHLAPIAGDPDSWRAAGFRPFTIEYFSGNKQVTLWTRTRLKTGRAKVDEAAFLSLLFASLSLAPEEKDSVLEKFPQLEQSQVDGLLQVLQQEVKQCAAMPSEHQAQFDAMQDRVLQGWVTQEEDMFTPT